MNQREALKRDYLVAQRWQDCECYPIDKDASNRHYFRLLKKNMRCILMDAPPTLENLKAFTEVAQHLDQLGLRVPKVYHADFIRGFALVEDLGTNSFSSLLSRGTCERKLYALAMDCLVKLQQHKKNNNIKLPYYNVEDLLNEVSRFIEYYYPAITGEKAENWRISSWQELWKKILDEMPRLTPTLVLRDFHVDNLMHLTHLNQACCALLDFQDAKIGEPAYDVMSLLEDARRSISSHTYKTCLKRYLDARTELDPHAFKIQLSILAAQRHGKVAGQFVQLQSPSNKYISCIPRVIKMLQRQLKKPILQPVKKWLEKYFPQFDLGSEERFLLVLTQHQGTLKKHQKAQ